MNKVSKLTKQQTAERDALVESYLRGIHQQQHTNYGPLTRDGLAALIEDATLFILARPT